MRDVRQRQSKGLTSVEPDLACEWALTEQGVDRFLRLIAEVALRASFQTVACPAIGGVSSPESKPHEDLHLQGMEPAWSILYADFAVYFRSGVQRPTLWSSRSTNSE